MVPNPVNSSSKVMYEHPSSCVMLVVLLILESCLLSLSQTYQSPWSIYLQNIEPKDSHCAALQITHTLDLQTPGHTETPKKRIMPHHEQYNTSRKSRLELSFRGSGNIHSVLRARTGSTGSLDFLKHISLAWQLRQ